VFVPVFQLDYGRHLIAADRATEAVAILATYVEHFPRGLAGRLELGRALVATGDGHRAVPHLAFATQRDPGRREAWRLLAEAHELAGDPAAAARARQRADVTR
jgi:predicted Zn-dependent protease